MGSVTGSPTAGAPLVELLDEDDPPVLEAASPDETWACEEDCPTEDAAREEDAGRLDDEETTPPDDEPPPPHPWQASNPLPSALHTWMPCVPPRQAHACCNPGAHASAIPEDELELLLLACGVHASAATQTRPNHGANVRKPMTFMESLQE
jgi:hypothetical protein